MCNSETNNARLKATMQESAGFLNLYEDELKKKNQLEKEFELLIDESNLVKWKTQQNIASEKTEDGKFRYTNQEQRDIALELNLRSNDGYSELKSNIAKKKSDLDNCKIQLDLLPRRIRQKEMELKSIELWRY